MLLNVPEVKVPSAATPPAAVNAAAASAAVMPALTLLQAKAKMASVVPPVPDVKVRPPRVCV